MASPSACCRGGGALRANHPLIALVHHPLALETGLSASEQRRCARASARRSPLRAAVVVTSAATARRWSPTTASAERISVVQPGTDRWRRAAQDAGEVVLLAVGA